MSEPTPTDPKQDPLVHHVFDDIVEHDNKLPNWWLMILWGSIIFAFGYWMRYHVTRLGEDQLTEYRVELERVTRAQQANRPKVDEATLMALVHDQKVTQVGAETFAATCSPCHGPMAQGLVGPNLTDRYWLHGFKATDIHKVISTGVLEKGMPAWEKQLGAERVRALTAFVLSLRGKEVPGKPPEGQPMP